MKVVFISNALLRFLKTDEGSRDLNKPIKVYSRNSVILEDFVDQVFNVYDGRKFVLVRVTPEMVGFKFGDFALSKLMTGAIHNTEKSEKKATKKSKLSTKKK